MAMSPKSDRNQHFSYARWRDAISPIGEISLGDQMPIIAWRRRRIFSSWMRYPSQSAERQDLSLYVKRLTSGIAIFP